MLLRPFLIQSGSASRKRPFWTGFFLDWNLLVLLLIVSQVDVIVFVTLPRGGWCEGVLLYQLAVQQSKSVGSSVLRAFSACNGSTNPRVPCMILQCGTWYGCVAVWPCGSGFGGGMNDAIGSKNTCKTFSTEFFDWRIQSKKSSFSTGSASRISHCAKKLDLDFSRKGPFSIDKSDCIRNGLMGDLQKRARPCTWSMDVSQT